jgi:hypothetical protein
MLPSTLIRATWMPLGPRSRASDCAKPRIANFAGPNETDFGLAFTPAVAPVKSIVPRPRAIIAGAASLAATNAPKVLIRQYVRLAEIVANGAKRFSYLRLIADITTEIEHGGPALPDVAGECVQIVRFAREHGDGVGRSEASDK